MKCGVGKPGHSVRPLLRGQTSDWSHLVFLSLRSFLDANCPSHLVLTQACPYPTGFLSISVHISTHHSEATHGETGISEIQIAALLTNSSTQVCCFFFFFFPFSYLWQQLALQLCLHPTKRRWGNNHLFTQSERVCVPSFVRLHGVLWKLCQVSSHTLV